MMLPPFSTLSPEAEPSRRPSRFMRSYSRVPGGACSMPTMAVTMPLRWMNSIWLPKDRRRVAVEADDEAALHLQAGRAGSA